MELRRLKKMRKTSVERCYVAVIRAIIIGCCYHFWSESIAIGLLALCLFDVIETIQASIARQL